MKYRINQTLQDDLQLVNWVNYLKAIKTCKFQQPKKKKKENKLNIHKFKPGPSTVETYHTKVSTMHLTYNE